MKAPLFTALLALCSAALVAQAPVSAPVAQAHTSDLGFSYSLPVDWEVVDTAASLPVVQQQVAKSAASEEEKKGISCVQIALTARHGAPPSVVVVVALPFACFGQTLSDSDLPGFAMGASEGIKNTFDIVDPVYGLLSGRTQRLDRARYWAAQGSPRGEVHGGNRLQRAEEGRGLLDDHGRRPGRLADL
jgi:hypothetical protein